MGGEMKTHTVTFRGESVEVLYEDMGHEPDCNAHVIEWSFADGFFNHLRLSDKEEQSIYDQLKDHVDGERFPSSLEWP